MEGDIEASKVHYFYNWIGEGSSTIYNWMRKGTLISQEHFDKLTPEQRKLESYFILFKQMLSPRSNPLLAVEDLHSLKQNSRTTGEFYSQAHKIVQRCNIPNKEAKERAIRDTLYLGMRSQIVKDKCINFMNDGEELTTEFIMRHLEVEDSNSHHKSLSQMDSTTSVNFMSYDHRKGKGKGHDKHGGKGNSSAQRSRNGPRIQNSKNNAEKCGKCGKHKHQDGQKCPTACDKIGHFYKVCRSTKRQQNSQGSLRSIHNVQVAEDDTYRNEIGQIVPSPPLVNMIKVINKVKATQGLSEASKQESSNVHHTQGNLSRMTLL